ncbi:hypothetical protein G6O67_002636 [Ophiocordyceps sinensis]|uniref:Cdc23 domain-containing protein n=1 Tax=Ophiocordyceps sinensis TaxID=72228 RepID=A0A8H4V7H4_9HYPO|nr:hypothetical protein G6O67_002636 [Ophiocordyceps sinensis]
MNQSHEPVKHGIAKFDGVPGGEDYIKFRTKLELRNGPLKCSMHSLISASMMKPCILHSLFSHLQTLSSSVWNSGSSQDTSKLKLSSIVTNFSVAHEFSYALASLIIVTLYKVATPRWEKLKNEELGQVLGPSDIGATFNKQLIGIKHILDAWFNQAEKDTSQCGASYGWLQYLYGAILAKDGDNDTAISWLLKSVSLYPWNWGAWLELSNLIRNVRHLNLFVSPGTTRAGALPHERHT